MRGEILRSVITFASEGRFSHTHTSAMPEHQESLKVLCRKFLGYAPRFTAQALPKHFQVNFHDGELRARVPGVRAIRKLKRS